MKEYIFQPTIAQDAGVITIADAPTGLTKKNILAIINKTTKGIVHSPLVDGVATVSYAGTELAIILNAGHESIQGNLLIKAYTDDAAGGYDEMLAQFFGLPEALPSGYEFMTDTEVTEELEDIMGSLDNDLTETVEYPEGSGTYMTRAQAITAQAMNIINPSES